ncbi:MAG: DUF2917 domain-containing protein, partial [Comamonadaceae bacterium]
MQHAGPGSLMRDRNEKPSGKSLDCLGAPHHHPLPNPPFQEIAMSTAAQTLSQQSGARLPGTWKLGSGRAATLRPREDGTLRIAHGRVWLTFDGPHAGAANDQGDRFLGAGDHVRVRAGRRVVIESCDAAQPVYFSWDFAFEAAPIPARAVAQSWS